MTVFICGVPASPARGLGFISPISPWTLCACKRIEVPKTPPRRCRCPAARWTDAHRVPRHSRTEETFPRPRFFGLDVSKRNYWNVSVQDATFQKDR